MRKTNTRLWFCVALLTAAVSSPQLTSAQTYSVAYNLGSSIGDPLSPAWSLVAQGRDGNLYSTSPKGGTLGNGTVFKITPAGTLTVLYDFDVTHGSLPYGGLTLGADGNLYGTTYQGGTGGGGGTIFKITPTGTLTVLYNFKSGVDGTSPYGAPIQGVDGNFYGTTYNGGNGYGTVYKLTSANVFTTLYKFDNTHGGQPHAPLVQGTDGALYGTTYSGGNAGGYGTVFKVTTAGVQSVLYNFDNTHGANPFSPLLQGTDGSFYGATYGGGSGSGVVFKITTAGVLTVLPTLNGASDGGGSFAGLVQVHDGSLYGVAQRGGSNFVGTIFRVTTTGTYSVLNSFARSTGDTPQATLLEHTTGTFYGTTIEGGTSTGGVVYSFKNGQGAFVRTLPTSGKVGKSIGVLGQGFTGATIVAFNGTSATFAVTSDTYLTATIPSGATTGFLTVTTPGGKLTSDKKFRVTPVVTSFSPTSGAVGTPVVITGNSLTQTSKVTFGGVKALTFVINSDTQVTATVPAGALTGKISITTPGGTAQSATSFTVTP
jgi:uncharacterized repeat protein (TIGR03803 family)